MNKDIKCQARINCVRAKKLTKGCVVRMRASSGLRGYGNPQCVSSVCEPLGEISLYGHNEHYKDYDIAEILEYPLEVVTENATESSCAIETE